MAEVFRTLTDGVFADLPADGKNGGKVVVSRNLQRAYVARLGELVLGPKSDLRRVHHLPRRVVRRRGGPGRRRAAWPGST